jgi:hypothetical protein
LLHGRVVIPIRNEDSELIAYAGRFVDGSEPKYSLPERLSEITGALQSESRAPE